jgi:hypothetical protein
MTPRLLLLGSTPIGKRSLAEERGQIRRLLRRLIQDREQCAPGGAELDRLKQANAAICLYNCFYSAVHESSLGCNAVKRWGKVVDWASGPCISEIG